MSTLAPEPLQPPESTWQFVDELQSPFWQKIHWKPRAGRDNEANFKRGVSLQARFKDDCGLLDTAYQDLDRFFDASGIKRTGPYPIITDYLSTPVREAFRIIVTRDQCTLLAGDTEGIRRAIIYLEDEILRAGGPFLPLGTIDRQPVIRTRVTRCFFGPIHRPPRNRDELTDDVNYYPDEYLNRLAHEGVNGLWLTIHFGEICRSTVIPEYGRDTTQRLNKLRRTVEQCGRYGIKIYAFANEPIPIPRDGEVAKAHPELVGHPCGDWNYFCTSNPTGKAYLEEALYNLFTDVPGLGGLINISIGEHGSHCYSGWLMDPNTCPRCADRKPREVLNDTLEAMERGMRAANPDAELISWPYSQYVCWGDELTVDSAGCLPKGVILQHNFESSGEGEQCGRKHKIQDYWLSWIGPSKLFTDCAKAAVKNGNRMHAKLQVGCSHEVATAPYVPVPGHLYWKYRAMHELGVSGAMQCWYFGNYPGIMTKAAGELSFAPLAETEDEFLLRLAQRDWGKHAPLVVRAWQLFQSGYSNFPLNHVFGWYGPVHDSVVWPLHLEPADRGISPSWLIAWNHNSQPIPVSGDRIGECFTYTHSLKEVLSLCKRMARDWNQGTALLEKLLPHYSRNEERLKDLGVAIALGIQFESAYNIMHFYALREELPVSPRSKQLKLLERMREIVKRELELDAELLELCKSDSRLGFHSEAEGYKYFPAKIEWRMQQLQDLLKSDFPRIETQIQNKIPLWPEYTGKKPAGQIYHCQRVSTPPGLDGNPSGPGWEELKETELEIRDGKRVASSEGDAAPEFRTTWKACYDESALYVGVRCRDIGVKSLSSKDSWQFESLVLYIEPRRLWPNQYYEVAIDGETRCNKYPAEENRWSVQIHRDDQGWSATFCIPHVCLREEGFLKRPMRIDIERRSNRREGLVLQSWMEHHPLESRLVFGTANPVDLGWLVFE